MNHHWARKLLKDFETNPATQIRFHFAAMVFWTVNLLAGTMMLIFFPNQWIKIGVFYVFALSIYANFDTDYGAVSAAQAYLYAESVSTNLQMSAQVTDSGLQTVDVIVEQTESHVAPSAERPPEASSA